jgi:hypothetical protein
MSGTKTLYLLWLALLLLASVLKAQTNPPPKGPQVGEAIPAFKLRDQFGHEQTFDTMVGPKGLVLLFFRSADW